MNGSVAQRDALVASLRQEVEKLAGGRAVEDEPRVSTGVAALDRLLPGGGLARGTLVEYLSAAGGSGAATLSLAAVREACGEKRALVVVEQERSEIRGQRSEVRDKSSRFKLQNSTSGDGGRRRGAGGRESIGRFYPPAAVAWGIDLSAMLVLRTANEADAVWAFDQALRCPGVGAVWGAWERLDMRDFRRLQLAAEIGGTIGVLIRPARVRGQPTWAEVKWEVCPAPLLGDFASTGLLSRSRKSHYPHPNPLPKGEGTVYSQRRNRWQLKDGRRWRLQVGLVRCRGAAGGQKVVLELDEMNGMWREADYESTHSMSVFAELADSTARGA